MIEKFKNLPDREQIAIKSIIESTNLSDNEANRRFIIRQNRVFRINFASIELTSLPPELSEFRTLRVLNIHNNKLSEINYRLSRNKYLQTVTASDNLFTKLLSFQNLPRLQKLSLDRNNIDDISDFPALTKLKSLSLNENKIVNMKPLEKCLNLAEIFISRNAINSNISVPNLVKLRWLDLSHNKIEDNKTQLPNLPAMWHLIVSYNLISDANSIAKLPKLQYLDLSYNQIKDIMYLKDLHNLRTLYVTGNPLCSKFQDLEAVNAWMPLQKRFGRKIHIWNSKNSKNVMP